MAQKPSPPLPKHKFPQLSLPPSERERGNEPNLVAAMLPTQSVSGVSNCYVFKSRLQEYTQKVGLSTPVYHTIKEGPSHEPLFKSSVVVNNIRYDSLPEFANRKAAEQSAAEVALMELAKAGQMDQSISVPVHETGLCKNLLQEYAQKMNYAIPLYRCEKQEKEGRTSLFTCSVEVGGVRYIGAGAKLKKDAEIKAARTALLSIHAAASESSDTPFGSSQLTVVPCKKRGPERTDEIEEIARVPKAKKAKYKNRMLKKRLSSNKVNHIGGGDTLATDQSGPEPGQCASDHALVPTNGVPILQGTEDRSGSAGQNELDTLATDQPGPEPGQCAPDHALVPTNGVPILQGTEDRSSSAGQNELDTLATDQSRPEPGQCAPDHALVPTNGVPILQGTEDHSGSAGQNGIKAFAPDYALVPTDGVADLQGTADRSGSDTI